MKQILQHKGIAVMAGLSALAAAGLTTLCLLNIPSFYELDQPGKVKLFLLVLAGFAIAAFFATRWFVLPYTRSYTDRGNALLIALLGAILLAAFVFSSPYLWTIPQIQDIAICYESENASEHLSVVDARDAGSNRLYSPESLGSQKYPIAIAANTCLEGTEVALTAMEVRDFGHALAVTVNLKNVHGRAVLRLNNLKKSYALDSQGASPGNERLALDVDPNRPDTFLVDPWGRQWMMLARWGSLISSSAYMALVLFGISEKIIVGAEQ